MLKKINNLTISLAASLVVVIAAMPSMASAHIAPDSTTTNPQQTTSSQPNPANPQPAGATTTSAQTDIQCGINEAAGGDCSAGANNPSGDLSTTIKTILNILSAIAGVAAVIMIIVAGLRLVTSAGNEEGVKKAKGTIIYAVVGLVIVAVAQVIVHFVITNAA